MKMYRSEDDIMTALQRHDDQQKSDADDDDDDDDDGDTITICENEDQQQQQQPNVRALARQFEQKTNSLPGHNRTKLKNTPDNSSAMHLSTVRTIINEQPEENDEEELTWPQHTQQIPTQSSGIKKFVRNGLKLFSVQSQQQQNKKSGK